MVILTQLTPIGTAINVSCDVVGVYLYDFGQVINRSFNHLPFFPKSDCEIDSAFQVAGIRLGQLVLSASAIICRRARSPISLKDPKHGRD